MARRRNNISEFFDGFNQSYGSVRKVLQDKELMDIAKAESVNQAPVDDATATPVVPGEVGTTTVTPVSPQQTKFLGQTYDKPLTDQQISSGRTMAMAGVMKKYGDPVGGLRLEQQARQGDQQAKLADLQIGQAERQGKRDEKADAHAAAIEAVDRDVSDWNTKRLTNPDGSMRQMTIDDQLEAGQYRVSKLIGAGKLTEANALAKDNMGFASNKIQLQTAERNEALAKTAAAVASGDLSSVGQFYDKYVPDGAKVSGITVDPETGKISITRKTVDGRDAPPVTFKDRNEMVAGLQVLKDPMALYNFSQSEFARNLQVKADTRADNADKRADKSLTIQAGQAASSNALHGAQLAKLNAETADKNALSEIQTSLVAAIDKGDKDAEGKARAKLMTYTIGAKGVQMSDTERKANFFLASGAAKTPMEAAKMAHEKVQTSPKDDYLKLTTSAMPLQGDQLDEAMATLHGTNWKSKVQGNGGEKPMEFGSSADLDAAVKAGKVKKGDRVMVNGRSATWQ